MDVANRKLAGVAEVSAIHFPLVFVNIVGERDAPTRTFQTDPHQSNASKKLGEGFFEWAIHICCQHSCTFNH